MLTINIATAQFNINLGGREAGSKNTTIGYRAGYFEGSASEIPSSYASNTFLGHFAGIEYMGGYNNTFIGGESGGKYPGNPSAGKSMQNSTFLGYRSGYSSRSGIGQNVFIGANAGYSLTTGSGNVFIGYNAGYSETGSNKLYIDNSNTSTPLIYGDFDLDRVGVNTLPGTYTLNVGGAINATGLFVNGTAVSMGVTTVSPWTLDGNAVNYNNGNVGIGIVSNVPAYKLDVAGTVNATNFLMNGAALPFTQWTTSSSLIYYMGNVGIGTSSTGSFKLAVEGKIGAREVQVTTANPWPDYVFLDDYSLTPLSEVEQFIKANKHLSQVPSAEQVKKDGGHELGDMDVILLKKVEELTLYLIEQNKKLERLQVEIRSLKELTNEQAEEIKVLKDN